MTRYTCESENSVKSQIKDYLAIKRIYNFPLVQGLGAHRGVPDRVMFFQGSAHFLEIKRPGGKLSEHQKRFKEQCELDCIPYHVIKQIEDLRAIVDIELKPDPVSFILPVSSATAQTPGTQGTHSGTGIT